MIYGKDKLLHCVISSFHHGVNEIFALLGCYTALTGSLLLIGCPESSVKNYRSKLVTSQNSEDLNHTLTDCSLCSVLKN